MSWPKNPPRGRRAAWGQEVTAPAPAEWPDPSSRPTRYLTGDTLLHCLLCFVVRVFFGFFSTLGCWLWCD